MKVAACILSAGKSKRMGQHKALLKIKNETFLTKVIKDLRDALVKDIYVVISESIIREKAEDMNIKWIFNREPEKGPLFSFQLCIKTLENADAVLLVPVDHPFVKNETYKILTKNASHEKILVPVYRGKRGHPALFPKKFFNDILEAPLNIGARYVLRKKSQSVLEIEVNDPGILMDIDTPSDLEKALEREEKKC